MESFTRFCTSRDTFCRQNNNSTFYTCFTMCRWGEKKKKFIIRSKEKEGSYFDYVNGFTSSENIRTSTKWRNRRHTVRKIVCYHHPSTLVNVDRRETSYWLFNYKSPKELFRQVHLFSLKKIMDLIERH